MNEKTWTCDKHYISDMIFLPAELWPQKSFLSDDLAYLMPTHDDLAYTQTNESKAAHWFDEGFPV